MNRLIKFRGKFQGIWWHATPEDDGWDQFWVLVDKKTVGQYVGLSDKKKVEIYDSDVVNVTADYGKYSLGNFIVKWGHVGWESDRPVENMSMGRAYMKDDIEFEVVGNIYDSPELKEHVED